MRCLKKDGHLIITVPNSRELAERYITRDITHFIFSINMTGPYHGKETDHHAWCYDYEELKDRVKDFDFEILTADKVKELGLKGKVALDWWICAIIVTHKTC